MSRHTVELRWLIEQAERDAHGTYADFQYTDATWKALGLDAYELYDESHREELNAKIANHFYMREIGAETAALFRLWVMRTMMEVMPYYNMLYKAQSSVDDPLTDRDLRTTENWEIGKEGRWGNDSSGTVGVTDESRSVYSDTPMSMLSNSGSPSVRNLDYATNATYDDGATNTASESQSKGTTKDDEGGERVREEKGRTRSQASLYKEFKDFWDNIDQQVIRELEPCFLTVYG